MGDILHELYQHLSQPIPQTIRDSAQWKTLRERSLQLEQLLYRQLDAQGRQALDDILCTECEQLELRTEAIFRTGVCLGLEIGRLTPPA